MQVRRLSPTSLWIEMPLSLETPRLVWRAKAAAGLRQGKINSYLAPFFDSVIPDHQHLVEGRTPSGLFQDNTRIVVELLPEEGGTRLDVDGARTDGGIDLSFRLRKLKRHYTQEIEQFLLAAPTNSQGEEPAPLPPLASPTGDAGVPFVEAQPGVVLPLHVPTPSLLQLYMAPWRRDWKKALAQNVFWGVVAIVVYQFSLWGPALLGLAGHEIWLWKKHRSIGLKFNWISFLLLALIGTWQTVVLLRRWF